MRKLTKITAQIIAMLTALTIFGLPLAAVIWILIEILEELENKK